METEKTGGHIVSYRVYFVVWTLLIVLTGLLVLASRIGESMAVYGMLVLTPLKAGLVLFFFMHLKYEKTWLRALVFMTLGLLVMVIAGFFLDISYR